MCKIIARRRVIEHGFDRIGGRSVIQGTSVDKNHKKIKYFKVWQDRNDAKEIHTTAFPEEKMNYIHNNPVRAVLVANPEDYLYSSARDYSGEKGLVKIILI